MWPAVALITPPAGQPLSSRIEKSFPISDVTAENEPAQQIAAYLLLKNRNSAILFDG